MDHSRKLKNSFDSDLNFSRKYYTIQARRKYAAIAQLVERSHGKGEVSGSSPDGGSSRFS